MMVLALHNFFILAEFGHSDRNGGILHKERKNSAKIGMVGSYAHLRQVIVHIRIQIHHHCPWAESP